MWSHILTYNAGSHNLSFDFFDMSVDIHRFARSVLRPKKVQSRDSYASRPTHPVAWKQSWHRWFIRAESSPMEQPWTLFFGTCFPVRVTPTKKSQKQGTGLLHGAAFYSHEPPTPTLYGKYLGWKRAQRKITWVSEWVSHAQELDVGWREAASTLSDR